MKLTLLTFLLFTAAAGFLAGCGGDGPEPVCGECPTGQICQQGMCACDSQATLACQDGDVWWLDGCGQPESIQAACDHGCLAGACLVCQPDCADAECGPDGCGETCGTCGDGRQCEQGSCTCIPHAWTTCDRGDVWWVDGCGQLESLNAACENGCLDALCVGCRPACTGLQCGPDGCGGSCGSCSAPDSCDAQGACTCTPDCAARQCGSDGCGGSCGTCQAGQDCTQGACVCTPQAATTCHQGDVWWVDGCGQLEGLHTACDLGCQDATCIACEPVCAGRACGSDGCGDSCGSCVPPESCDAQGQCTCSPVCSGRQCGPDGCGGSCGTCSADQTCADGTCWTPSVAFAQPLDQPLSGTDPVTIRVADFDGDGRADLAVSMSGVASGDGQIAVLLGAGTGAFTPDAVAVPLLPTGLVAADLTGDGLMDLAAADGALDATEVVILTGDGAGGFTFSATSSIGRPARAIAAADLDGVAGADLAVAGGQGVSIHLAQPGGEWAPGVPVADSQLLACEDIAIADLNADGRPDLLVPQAAFLAAGDGTFTRTDDLGPGQALAVGDLDADGRPDLVAVSGGELRAWLGNGDGSFHFGGLAPLGGSLSAVALGDLDEDGRLDAVAIDEEGDRALVVPGAGDGTWLPELALPTCPGPQAVALGDWNQDGRADLSVACRGLAEASTLWTWLQGP